ncbi:hypothetical protein GSI_11251 [Ganoderma sinense ZZ0214-1]|uniref:Uncharacterized protein n=1 Tax=Ganoderma sinense ZZ0214-1 TaxID=1077348 RepID=A0A2G8RYU2_9APHY|nr:hypothetical protein GSI_11251 [Ganoderma sinense ZZ0214-1]
MRLLDTATGQFISKDPNDPETKYAILSHTWDPEGEQTIHQLREIQKRYVLGYQSLEDYSSDSRGGPLSPNRRPPSPDPPTLDSEIDPPETPVPTVDKLPPCPQVVDSAISKEQITPRPILLWKQVLRSFPISRFTRRRRNHHTNLDRDSSSYPSTPSAPIHSPTQDTSHGSPNSLARQWPSISPPHPEGYPSHSLLLPDLSRSYSLDPPELHSIWDDPHLSPKIRNACEYARVNGYRYIWIDSCCIDQASSSELSEAINSMYHWYARADVCYAFLADVPAGEDHQLAGSCFRRSRWFSRGWTLQELIAPLRVVFLSKDWTIIGSKRERVDLVTEITAIPFNALLHAEPLDKFSVAQRLSWTSKRETTRAEDRAYCLLGIFDINMAPLYGEGDRAFRRLQEEIMRRIPDQSLFAWGEIGPSVSFVPSAASPQTEPPPRFNCHRGNLEEGASLLAVSPRTFRDARDIEADSHDAVFHRLRQPTLPALDYDFTPHGIRTKIPVIPLSEYLPAGTVSSCPDDLPLSQWYLVILGCHHQDVPGHLLGRICCIPPSPSGVEFLYSGCQWVSVSPQPQDNRKVYGLLSMSQKTIERLQSHIKIKTIYIPHPTRANGASEVARWQSHQTIRLILEKQICDPLLARQGYTATLRGPDPKSANPTTHRLSLIHLDHIITVELQHKIADDGQAVTIFVGQVRVTGPPGRVCNPRRLDQEKTRRAEAGRWNFHKPWNNQHWTEQVVLRINDTKNVTIDLTLDFATQDHYLLHVDVRASPRRLPEPADARNHLK